ncbi:MAG: GMC family oxidoreductase [Alphaproteobacteria bacterium]|nr:GMC family oxidoreductase [Alphaproteobacteria bacterium]
MSGAIYTAADLTRDQTLDCEVCVVGTGAGGAVLAAGLAEGGLDVVMLEEGSHHTAATFSQLERVAYATLYQERAARTTDDTAITILQGRSVGGGTTVNWTTCYRTPDRVLHHWARQYGLEGLSPEALAPHFEAVEERLRIGQWPEALVNANNRVLMDGCRALGWHAEILRRNVFGCRNSGLCGLGCPYDAKQGMLLTYVPDAVAAGARLYANTRAWTLTLDQGRVTGVRAEVMAPDSHRPTGVSLTVRARVVAVCGGAINSPALLLRSGLDLGGRVGARTTLHPVVGLAALHDREIAGYAGAPQSAASHQFTDRGDEVGFFIEVSPVQPMLAGAAFPPLSPVTAEHIGQLPRMSTLLAIHHDGMHPGCPGGTVWINDAGHPRLRYPVPPPLASAFRDATRAMAQIAFAGGARQATTYHRQPITLRSADALGALDDAAYGALAHSIFSAHLMGGCVMGSVVDAEHRVEGVPNLFVVDGSVFPTALGVNPSLSIYGIAHRARRFVGEAV